MHGPQAGDRRGQPWGGIFKAIAPSLLAGQISAEDAIEQ